MTTIGRIRYGSVAFEAVPLPTRRVLGALSAFWNALERAGQRRAAAELGRLAEWTAHDEARSAQLREAAAVCRESARAPRA
jgi:hypothetical protein